MYYSSLPLTLSSDSSHLFFILSVALRKLEAKWRNEKGKLERHDLAKTYTSSQKYTPPSHKSVFFKSACYNELKTHYLETCESLTLVD